jgi:aspartyl-tRNA(Asn)/glutamyl-tRNA(Gln) amidotransferase subunit B
MGNAVKQDLETVIGLEVHLQLDTKTKIFCGCENDFGREPNTRVCPVCLGLPGTLPVFNEQALNFAVKIALALNCQINRAIKFDRKNYYYPDLPKGYQISQHTDPIAANGVVTIKTADGGAPKQITIRRAHLEEDAGKLIHDAGTNCSLVDYNRTGTPLMEIVTEPDLRSPQEAYDYLQTLKLILQYLDVSDCDMEKGSLRCDANVSLREKGQTTLGTKAELKNMNSFKAVKIALEFEVNRQRQMILAGERIIQETRLWSEEKQVTLPMRSKEEAHDYRYFPEPDLVPFTVSEETIQEVKKTLPELPAEKLKRFMQQYELPEYDAQIIIQDRDLANFFEESAKHFSSTKKISNWIIGPLQSELNARKASVKTFSLTPPNFTDLIRKVEDGVVSNLVGKDILKMMIDQGKTADQVIAENGLAQVSDDATLEKAVDEIIAANPGVVEQIKQGKDSAMGFLVGQTMKKTQGKANPKKVGEIIKRRLSNG